MRSWTSEREPDTMCTSASLLTCDDGVEGEVDHRPGPLGVPVFGRHRIDRID
jgi:hypothetical protein